MTDASERFDGVEQRLGAVEHGLEDLKGHVGQLDHRLEKVEERLNRVEGRLDGIDKRLDGIDGRLDGIDGRLGQMDKRMTSLEGDVQTLRVLGEETAGQARLIAEVQSHHGKVLGDLTKAVEPLDDLRILVGVLARDHERRLAALEHAAGQPGPPS